MVSTKQCKSFLDGDEGLKLKRGGREKISPWARREKNPWGQIRGILKKYPGIRLPHYFATISIDSSVQCTDRPPTLLLQATSNWTKSTFVVGIDTNLVNELNNRQDGKNMSIGGQTVWTDDVI